MLIKRIIMLVIALLSGGLAFAAESDLQIRSVKPGATVSVDRVMDSGKLLVNVVDEGKNPLFGLVTTDFTVTQSGRTAKIISVQPLAENLDVPRHIVMVLDNSASMDQRGAIKDLLAGVSELLKIVRPIDDVQMVVFDDDKTVNMGGRNLHVRTFRSNQPSELQDFAVRNYGKKSITNKTVLYEGMLAGLDLIDKLPVSEPRFMVVFSDGEDINSEFKPAEVLKAAEGLKRFNAYAIDYLEGKETNKFLAEFARQNSGQVWKATSETNLVPIFQNVASKMQYYYVVSYQFPPTGKLTVAPASLMFDEVRTMTAAAKTGAAVSELRLQPVVDSAYGIARWKVAVSNAKGSVAELAGEGTPAAELKIPLPTADLAALAAGGDLAVKMELQDINGQSLVLATPPVKVTVVRTSANLAVMPAGLKIEEIKTIDASPMLGQVFFDKGSYEIHARYVRFMAAGETAGFDEQKFRDTLEKYYQLLNIIGKRLTDTPEATIRLVGCNDNTGTEKGKKKLSSQRAEAVKNYLQTVWSIAPERMTVEARNLPAIPGTSKSKEGQAENRRVEIQSANAAVLSPIRSTYLATRIDASVLILRPDVVAPNGIDSWKITVANTVGKLAELSGKGAPDKELKVPLGTGDLRALAAAGDIMVKMELQDRKGQKLVLDPTPVKVTFVETKQLLAQKEGLLVQEKYALILFDFDKDTISGPNQEIVERIVARIKTLPEATATITGHTDNIGKEAYNVKLSERRALAVNKLLLAAYGENTGDRIRSSGVGPNSPLYENVSPETRSFNRTVTITLEYKSAE